MQARWIVKLGGSLAQSPHLPLWLNALVQTDSLIVPGGGPFADAVRTAHAHWRFDQTTAHHMAILGMCQYGRMLLGLCPGLAAVSDLDALREPPQQARVWLPVPAQLDAAGLPPSWDITSDSLAAWLAGQTGAAHLLLVKAAEPDGELCGWVDAAFPRYAAGPFRTWLCGPSRHREFRHRPTADFRAYHAV